MSAQHWIDELFRKRMERQDFPVEDGEFEEVRALLREHNSTVEGVRGVGFSKWWLSALFPLAGLLWWAYGGNVDRSGERIPPTTEDRRIQVTDVAEQTDNGTSNAMARPQLHPSFAAVGTGPAANELPAIQQREQAASVSDVSAHARASNGQRSPKALRTQLPGSNEEKGQRTTFIHGDDPGTTSRTGHGEVGQDAGSRTFAADAAATPLSGLDDVRSVQVDVNSSYKNEAALKGANTSTQSDQTGMETRIDEQNNESPTGAPELTTARFGADAVVFMQPRWSIPQVAGTPEPIHRDVEAFKEHPMGELHFFGAPLAVRTRSSSGERSDAGTGSLVGLDYRVRAKRFSWATGIHYGSYALKGDQGATDVKLNFVEVPLLASFQLSRRRFGVSLQGGLSMDLLFNSLGSYPVESGSPVGAFPDDAFRTVNCSWLLSPQVTYHVADHLSVNAGPLWKAQIGGAANAGPLDGARINSSGIAIGITWRLERSTF